LRSARFCESLQQKIAARLESKYPGLREAKGSLPASGIVLVGCVFRLSGISFGAGSNAKTTLAEK
jgi:hypothetical protein